MAVKAITEDLETRTEKKTNQKKVICAREWLFQRSDKGAYNGILSDRRLTDKEDFRKFFVNEQENIPGSFL